MGSISKPRGNGYPGYEWIGYSVSTGSPRIVLPAESSSRQEWSGGGHPRTVRISKRLSTVGVWAEAFRKELLAQMSEQAGAEHYGREIRESAQEKAEPIIGEELKRMGWEESDLERHRKGAAQKLKIALRLRQQTTMTLAWIAQRLQMGTKTHLSHLLYWDERDKS